MSKYDALGAFLRRWAIRNKADQVEISFAHIENTIGAILPKAALHDEWWSNDMNGGRSVQCRAWLESGFEARLLPNERVMFCRIKKRSVSETLAPLPHGAMGIQSR